MKQIKIFKTDVEPITNSGIEKLQREVNEYITTNGYCYDSQWGHYRQDGMEILQLTPLLNGTSFIIVLEVETANKLEG